MSWLNYFNPFRRHKNALTYKGVWLSGETPVGNYNYSPATAMRIPAVNACVRVLSESVAVLPLFMYKRTNAGKQQTTKHQLYKLLHDRPNAWQTSFEWRLTMMQDVLLWGNALCEIVTRNSGATIASLEPLKPDFEVKLIDGKLFYTVENYNNQRGNLSAENVFHIRGLGNHGYKGISPLEYAGRTLGLAEKAEQYSESVFDHGGGKRVAIKVPGAISSEDESRLRKDWSSHYKNNAKAAIINGGMEIGEVGTDPESTQYIDARKFQINEIARIFRLPPHLIGDLERATFSNIIQQDLEYLKYALWPWLERWEQAIQRDLISDKQKYYAEFDLKGLLRADPESRAKWYHTMRLDGLMTANEIRGIENMNPAKEGGDDLWRPVNMGVVGEENVELVQSPEQGRESN
ncbi:MAG: phage portal protein [FCB group bacterium]|nr:phage portal protein [FCB group bacterium]